MIDDQPTSASGSSSAPSPPSQTETVDIGPLPSPPPAAHGAAGSRPQHRPHEIPASIGPYRILEVIGEGGMGTVYRAEQREPVRRIVALKVVKLGMDTREVVARFEAERQALAMLSHPNVAKVFDAGMTDTGRPYFAMEFVAGVALTQYCEECGFNTRQRLELFIPICQAVQHAHQKGIIHRDLKPTNILVTLEDAKPVPKVIDFGIAKATNQTLTQHTLFTQTGSLIGTPEYMSPEQAMTGGLDVDTRTDVYSLGVILYELLTGALPLDAKALRAAGFEAMARLIRTSEPQKPSTRLRTLAQQEGATSANPSRRDTRVIQRELRGDLDWIVLKAMEKDRARRYETANALAMDLTRHLEDEPVLARPPSAAYRMHKFVSRNRLGVTAGAAVLVALLVGLALATVGFIRADKDRQIADAARIEAQSLKSIADDQRRLAVENARKAVENAKQADENAADAKFQLASGMIAQADALSLAGRLVDAHKLYFDAYARFVELKRPLLSAELGIWNSYEQAAFPLLSIRADGENVPGVALSPDGRTALTGGSDSTVKLWELSSGKLLRTFNGHNGTVHSVAFVPGGKTVLSGGWDKTLKLWDLQSGKLLRTFTGHTGAVVNVAVARDGLTALSASNDRTLKLWDLAAGTELRTFTGHRDQVWDVALSPDGRTALSASTDKSIKQWDLATGKVVRTLTGHTNDVTSVAISPDGQTALSGSWDNSLKLWNLQSGDEIRTFTGHSSGIVSVAFAPDGKTALSGGEDFIIKGWNLAGGKDLKTFCGHTHVVRRVRLSSDGRFAISGGADGMLNVWDLRDESSHRFTQHTNWVNCVAVAPDGRTALTGSNDSTVRLWDLAGKKELHRFTGHTRGVRGVAISSSGLIALSGSDDRTLKLWDLVEGTLLRTFKGHAGMVTSVAIAPDGRTAVSGSRDRTVKLWDLQDADKPPRTFTGHLGSVNCVAIAPDGRTALSGGDDGLLKLWDLKSGAELRTFTEHLAAVNGLAIAPDGRTALSGSEDHTMRLWDLAGGNLLRTIPAHIVTLTSVAFGPGGRTALSGSYDRTLKLWDLQSGAEIRTFGGHTDTVLAVAMSASGRLALSAAADHTLVVRDFARGMTQKEFEPRVAAAQAALQRNSNDPAALATLGEWYAFRGMDSWAIEILTRARERGAAVSPLTLARCQWNLDHFAEAQREFRIALEQSDDPAEKRYLAWCMRAVTEHR